MIKEYFSLIKPRTVLLMTFCSSIAFVIASKSLSTRLLIFAISCALGVSGSCALHNYLDMDIDLIMERTKRRPLPSGRVRPYNAILLGAVLLCLGLSLAFYLNFPTFILGLLASFDYLIVYTRYMKRRNPLNIILGSPAGGLPVLAGWTAVKGYPEPLALFLAAIVVTWIPNHIWNLATIYSDDYVKAKIPMLPAVVDLKKALKCTASTTILLFILSLYPYLSGFLGNLYLLITLPLGIVLVIGNLWLFIRPSKRGAYKMFKFSSPYLAIIFIAIILDLIL